MIQGEINFGLPRPADLFPSPDNQARRLYERMLYGPISNAEMRDQLRLLSYTRRLSDLREKLAPLGLTVRKSYGGNGVFFYSIERTGRPENGENGLS